MSLFLVTGGAGFIGSHVAHALVQRGDSVRVLDNLSAGRRSNLEGLEVGEVGSGAPVEFLEGSVSDPRAAQAACKGVEGVFHEAALVSVPRSIECPEESFEINVTGTFQLLMAAREAGVRKFLFASSAAIYGTDETVPKLESMTPMPVSPYAGDKLAGEIMLAVWGRTYGIQTVALRYFNVYGPRQADDSPYTGVIAVFVKSCLEKRPAKIYGDGGQTRDFVYVADVAHANLLAMDADLEPGAIFNVGTGSSISVADLQRDVARLAPGSDPPLHGPGRAGDVRHSLASIDRIRSILGYEPRVSWEEGLTQTVDWYRRRGS